ncbi:ATP-binding protein [Bifidobacterium animalis]|nr:ATP-binding protein [Bifidobacterium animalis]
MILEPWNMDAHPVCFITGNSGDGKTWLCTRMAEEAIQAGATVILADPVKGWDIGEPRLRRLERAGAAIIGRGEYDRLIAKLDEILAANIVVEPAPPLIIMVDDFSSLLWLLQHPEDTTPGMHVRIRQIMRRFDVFMRAGLLDVGFVFSGQRIEKSMLPAAWKEAWEAGAHLLSMRINGTYEVFTGRLDNSGTVSYPELEQLRDRQAYRMDVYTLCMVMARISGEMDRQQTILANRQRMGVNDNALHVGAITMLERLNAWCLHQLDQTDAYSPSECPGAHADDRRRP